MSGRADGQSEMRNLVLLLLLGEGGYASDDYSDHMWSLQEIQQGSAMSSEIFRA